MPGPTINSPAYGFQLLLQAAAIVDGATSWGSYTGQEPPDPDMAVTLLDTGGQNPVVNVGINFPRVQILVRGAKTDYNGAYGQCLAIRNSLLGIPITAPTYPELTSVTEVGDIQSLGRDSLSRPRFSMNYQCITTPLVKGFRQ